MAFFRPTLPDQIAVEYDVTIRSHGGLFINYLACRGLNREDLITDTKLPERTGIMANYNHRRRGLQSYHLSISRFNDKGEHTGTANWRRNPGLLLACHGEDLCNEIDKAYHIRVTKDEGFLQLYVNNRFAHGVVDRDVVDRDPHFLPIPDYGKFGFRAIGSDVMVDMANFKVFRIEPNQPVGSQNGMF
jgi:hypothetical protein